MKILSDFLNLSPLGLGFNINLSESTPPIIMFLCCIVVLNIVGLLCFVNALLYLTVIYITEHKIFLDKISNKPYLVKIVNLYKKMRFSFLLFDILLFFISIGSAIWLCSRIILSGVVFNI